MREDTLSGSEYRDLLEITGLSYDDQIWAYGLGLYRFSQSRDYSNLTRDERVLRRLVAIRLYDNDLFQTLGAGGGLTQQIHCDYIVIF